MYQNVIKIPISVCQRGGTGGHKMAMLARRHLCIIPKTLSHLLQCLFGLVFEPFDCDLQL